MKKDDRTKQCKLMYNLLCIILGASSLMLFATSIRLKNFAEELHLYNIHSPYLSTLAPFLQTLSITLFLALLMAIVIRIGYNKSKKEQNESEEKEGESK